MARFKELCFSSSQDLFILVQLISLAGTARYQYGVRSEVIPSANWFCVCGDDPVHVNKALILVKELFWVVRSPLCVDHPRIRM